MPELPAHTRLAAVGALALLAVSGCTAEARTAVTVTGPAASTITATLTLTGEVADTVASRPQMAAQLEQVLSSRTGKVPGRRVGSHRLSYTSRLSYAQLVANADVLGVRSATLSGTGRSVTFTAQLTRPDGLAAAIRGAVAQQSDADALAAAMLAQTRVVVAVSFPGGVTTARGPAPVTVSGRTATISQPVSAYRTGTLVVTGNPHPPLLTTGRAVAGLAALGALAGYLWLRRRRAAAR